MALGKSTGDFPVRKHANTYNLYIVLKAIKERIVLEKQMINFTIIVSYDPDHVTLIT